MTTTDQPAREVCGECGFDAAEWPRARALGELRAHVEMWKAVFAGHDDARLHLRPEPEVWSAVEYCVHTARVVEFWRDAAAAAAAQGVVELTVDGYPDADVHPYNDTRPQDALADLGRELARLAEFAETAPTGDWSAPLRMAPPDVEAAYHRYGLGDAGAGVIHAVHDALHHLGDIERGLR